MNNLSEISVKTVIKYLRDKEFKNLLDIGKKDSLLISEINKNRNVECVSVDISEADKLPYNDNSFDVVTFIQSYNSYKKPDEAMLEAKRVLKPGGLLIVSDNGIGGVIAWIVKKIFTRKHYRKKSKERIGKYMKKYGITVLEKEQIKVGAYMVVGCIKE